MSNFNGFTGDNDPVYYSRKTENTDGALTSEDTKQTGNSPVIPDGYVMAPKEPTKAMILSAMRDNETGEVAEIYNLMLAAAPQEVKGD